MDVWNYILGYRNTLKSVFETWVVHIPFNQDLAIFKLPVIIFYLTVLYYRISNEIANKIM